jgi:hypothetical protein
MTGPPWPEPETLDPPAVRGRWAVTPLAVVALVGFLLAVVTSAKYEALRSDIRNACPSAAALDLTKWIPVCKAVGFQETYTMPEDLER